MSRKAIRRTLGAIAGAALIVIAVAGTILIIGGNNHTAAVAAAGAHSSGISNSSSMSPYWRGQGWHAEDSIAKDSPGGVAPGGCPALANMAATGQLMQTNAGHLIGKFNFLSEDDQLDFVTGCQLRVANKPADGS